MTPARLVLIVCFVAGLVVPGLDLFLRVLPRQESGEKRPRAKRPSLTPSAELPTKLDEWVRDNFGFRDQLIRAAHRFKVRVLHESPVDNVLIGSDGWLFYAANGDGVDMRGFLGRFPVDRRQLREGMTRLAARHQALAARGITYLFVVAPDKQTVYPEHVPLRRPRKVETVLDAFVAATPPSFPLLDLRDALARERPRHDLYYRTDTHWNRHGAFVGFREIVARLAAVRPGVPTFTDDDLRFREVAWPEGDLATMLTMTGELPDVDQTWIWNPRPKAPLRVVLLGDSFIHRLSPFFDDRFVSVTVLPVATLGQFDLDAVLAAKPDLVIEEHVERYLLTW